MLTKLFALFLSWMMGASRVIDETLAPMDDERCPSCGMNLKGLDPLGLYLKCPGCGMEGVAVPLASCVEQDEGLLERLKKRWQIQVDIWMGRICAKCSEDVRDRPVQRRTDAQGTEHARFCSKGHRIPAPSTG